jgi:hypothetical protein
MVVNYELLKGLEKLLLTLFIVQYLPGATEEIHETENNLSRNEIWNTAPSECGTLQLTDVL